MMSILKNVSFYFTISFVVSFISYKIQSFFLFDYLKSNIVTLLLTLLAVNTATSGLIVSKMQDLVSHIKGIHFNNSIKQMKLSLLEQIVLIILSIVILIINKSEYIQFSHKAFSLDVLIVTVFVYSIAILWDTGKAIFVVIEEAQKLNNKNDLT